MHTNALIHEKSPYLKQHAHNPVDWLPWGDEAFDKAKRENKPIFLSVGYSTCHWCHVMAHESFEDEGVAAFLNREFVPVKIDREERPDVDRIYMLFVQASTGSGGWPMSVFLTPDRKPFFGGTYFPPDSRYGRPGFRDLLRHLANAWANERTKIEESGEAVLRQLRSMTEAAPGESNPDRSLFDAAFSPLRRSFDSTWGGFGSAPKFPRPVVLNYLLRFHTTAESSEALDMVVQTLHAMARGGMHDQLGGGFHRYSVDERWFVPHFEKMLYDQAQLAISYLEAFQITGTLTFRHVAEDIFRYVLRDMRDENGGFYSAEDADSPNPDDPSHSGEGAFYIWKQKEIQELLPSGEASLIDCHFGVLPDGNVAEDPHAEFTGRNILYQALPKEECAVRLGLDEHQLEDMLTRGKSTLFQARAKRPRPHLDNKILTSWNCLMISALAKGYAVLAAPEYLAAAEDSMSFLQSNLTAGDAGAVFRRYCDGEAAIGGMLDDYAFLLQASLDLFEISGKAQHLHQASTYAQRVLSFDDQQGGGFFSTLAGCPDLVMRMKEDYDGAEPSGNSVAADALLRLAHLTDSRDCQSAAERALKALAPKLKLQPTMAPQMLVALGRWLTPPRQVVVRCAEVDEETRALLCQYRKPFLPYTTVIPITDQAAEALASVAPFLASLERKGRLTVYNCQDFSCDLPLVID